jgi:hypothetical protein
MPTIRRHPIGIISVGFAAYACISRHIPAPSKIQPQGCSSSANHYDSDSDPGEERGRWRFRLRAVYREIDHVRRADLRSGIICIHHYAVRSIS